jgi:ABC-type Fe3+-siderophore transport system permease subunit
VSITTVGFGDLVPYSYIGRVIIMIAAFWGAFLISLLIVTVSKTFELSRNQKKAMHHLFLTRKAASSITSAMRYYMAKKRSKITQAQSQVGKDGKPRGISLSGQPLSTLPSRGNIMRLSTTVNENWT